MAYWMRDLMQLVVVERAEAIHMYSGAPPILEVKRSLHSLEGPKLTPTDVGELLHSVAPADNLSDLESEGTASFYFHFDDAAVFHVMAFGRGGHMHLEMRRFR